VTEPLVARVEVVPAPGAQHQVASAVPPGFGEEDMARIAAIANLAVYALQNELTASKESDSPGGLTLADLELQFGVSLQGEAKIPLIGPLLGAGIKAGATFQVKIKLTRP
jgi:hypothetical protein